MSLHSSWDSNQSVYHCHPCGRRSPLCCSWSLWLAAGSTGNQLDLDQSSHSCCPSRLSRPHPWSWHSRMDRCWHHKPKQQSWWTPASISSHSPLLMFRTSQGCLDSCWGSLVRWHYLWQGIFNIELKNILPNLSPPLTLAATAFCRANHQVYRLPESGSSCWVENTSEAQPMWIWALAAAAVVANIFIFAVVGFQVWAGAAKGGKAAFWYNR